MSIKKSILYYSEKGEANTEQTLQEAKTRAEELGITDIVVASTRRNTAIQAIKAFQGWCGYRCCYLASECPSAV
ncbi:MAG: hypothetical protein NWE83_09715 [Candidatus Bathyarchaeota archaeon]|nr:hypothetical protein [Candidatus Bathyarchaeota archaeon]